jgi:hypothetical protein
MAIVMCSDIRPPRHHPHKALSVFDNGVCADGPEGQAAARGPSDTAAALDPTFSMSLLRGLKILIPNIKHIDQVICVIDYIYRQGCFPPRASRLESSVDGVKLVSPATDCPNQPTIRKESLRRTKLRLKTPKSDPPSYLQWSGQHQPHQAMMMPPG